MNLRDIKKDIEFVLSAFVDDCYFIASFNPTVSDEGLSGLLDKAIDNRRRTVVLLDEISWMGGYDPDFPGYLKTAWDTMFSRHDKLVLVLCGSVNAWIKKNILDSTGFVGRFSRDYVLGELTLAESAKFWKSAADRLAPREIFDVLAITGGIPRYLEEIDPGLSADENIRRRAEQLFAQRRVSV